MGRTGQLALVGLGGVLGAVVRWLIAESWSLTTFPWPTLFANVVGCGLLGLISARDRGVRAQSFLATGLCGGLTTFSTLSLEVVQFVESGDFGTAVTYLVASVVPGLAAYVGLKYAGSSRDEVTG